MQPDERDAAWLWRMRREATDAASLAEGLTLDELRASMRDQRAIAYAVEQLGEAALASRRSSATSPPRSSGVRNRLVHDYQQTDWEIIWTILQESIPSLLESLDGLLPDERG
jgi:uncharacterized protein with HEPN domain